MTSTQLLWRLLYSVKHSISLQDCADLQDTVELMNKQDDLLTPPSRCPACANGDIPGGAHKCVVGVKKTRMNLCSPYNVFAKSNNYYFSDMRNPRACIRCR